MRDPTEREILEVMESLLGFYSKELKRSDDPEDKLTLRQVRLEAEKACRAFLSVAATPPSSEPVAVGLLREIRNDLRARADPDDMAVNISSGLWIRLRNFLATLPQPTRKEPK